jgi:small conductance mechanosensitive channel
MSGILLLQKGDTMEEQSHLLQDLWNHTKNFISLNHLFSLFQDLLFTCLGVFVIVYGTRKVKKILHIRYSSHIAVLLSNLFFYTTSIVLAFTILHQSKYNISTLLGAAGIFGIAVGFAAQTTVSNLISGIFLLLEQNFSIGDTIQIDAREGVIESINLLSTKIRTDDNQIIRIPNENLIKNPVTNFSFFAKRRIHLIAQTLQTNDPFAIQTILQSIIDHEPLIIDKKNSFIGPYQIGYHHIEFEVRVWIERINPNDLTDSLSYSCLQLGKEQNIFITIKLEK